MFKNNGRGRQRRQRAPMQTLLMTRTHVALLAGELLENKVLYTWSNGPDPVNNFTKKTYLRILNGC